MTNGPGGRWLPEGGPGKPTDLFGGAGESADAAAPALVEKIRPGDDLGVLLEQSPALTLGHAAPHSELDLVIECVGTALLHYRAVTADHCGLALGGTADEQFVR